MTLSRFISCAYAMFVEEYQRVGTDLLTAIEKVNESIGLTVAKPEAAVATEHVPSSRENDRALAELQKLVGGL